MLSFCAAGSAVFHRLAKHFDVVIIDEAAQAVEPSVMVPLVMGCKQVTHSCLLQADHGSVAVFLLRYNA
jgi:senataxin